MNDTIATPDAVPAWHAQPHAFVERDGVRYTLLGTAHVSRESVLAVKEAIASGTFDAVAIELDAQRLQALSDPDALAKLDLVKVIREGKAALFAANLGLAAYQRRLAEQLGIEPGAELKTAAADARALGLPVHLIDRDVGTTFKRISAKLGFFGRIKLGAGLVTGLFVDEEVGEGEIEKLKQGDMLEASFGEFAKESPALFGTLIDERDQYMAAALRESAAAGAHDMLVVIGAGHLQGLARYLREDARDPKRCAKSWMRCRRGRRFRGSRSPSPYSCSAASAGVSGTVATRSVADLLKQWVFFTAGFAALAALQRAVIR